MLEKEPSSYIEDSLEPSERQGKDGPLFRKVVKNVSNLNKSFDDIDTQKKSVEPQKAAPEWSPKAELNPLIGYFYVFMKNLRANCKIEKRE